MILTPHLLIGAAIGAKTHNLGLIVILALLSHVILDRIPHWDYPTSGIKYFRQTKNFKTLFIDFLKIAIDALCGILIVIFLAQKTNQLNNWMFILLGIFFAVLPDIFLFASRILCSEKTADKYTNFHHKFFHGPKTEKEGKITFLGLTTEILMIILTILVFFS
ncbi:MAG: hypothetical protein Q8N59_02535 [bacterium]|nr:hypothetical protein [bacterium]